MKTLLVNVTLVWGPHCVYNPTSLKVEHDGKAMRIDELADVEAFQDNMTFFNGGHVDFLNGKPCLVEVDAEFCKGRCIPKETVMPYINYQAA